MIQAAPSGTDFYSKLVDKEMQLYKINPNEWPIYLDLLFKALKTVKPSSVEAEWAFSAMVFLLQKSEIEWVIKPLMHWLHWDNTMSQKRLSKWQINQIFKTDIIYFCFYFLFFFVTGFGSGVNYSNPSFCELSESDPDRIGTEPQP